MPYFTEKPARVQAIQFDNNIPEFLQEFTVLHSLTPEDSKADYAMFKLGEGSTVTLFRGDYLVYFPSGDFFEVFHFEEFHEQFQQEFEAVTLSDASVEKLRKALNRKSEVKHEVTKAVNAAAPKRRGRPPKAKPAEEAKK